MRLYINKAHCLSIEQLREYFSDQIDVNSDIYWDLLDYGRNHDISKWLQEMGEEDLACQLEAIDYKLDDSAFFVEMCRVILGEEIQTSTKPDFSQCYNVENVLHEVTDVGATVFVCLKVLLPVNETFELKVQTDWGIRAENINPFYSKTGEVVKKKFSFRKQLNEDIDEIRIFVDGKEINHLNTSKKIDFEVNGVSFRMILADCDQSLGRKGLYMMETLVTQNLWNAVMGSVPCQEICMFSWRQYESSILDANKPVINISKYAIHDFVKKINFILGKNFRLPTDSEWESVAQGYSKDFSNLDNTAWHFANSNKELHDVATKSPNDNGFYDMIGNVWEFTKDPYIIRGGDYNTDIVNNLPIKEEGYEYRNKIGFRLVLCEDDNVFNTDFVDLGLSVLWARNTGYFKGRTPSVEECDELLKQCDILNMDNNVSRVTGPNGQYIYMKSNSWYFTSQYGHRHSNTTYAFHVGYHQISDIYDKNIKLRIEVIDKL